MANRLKEKTGHGPLLPGRWERYWETVIETMMDGLMVVDPKGGIVAVNPAMERLTGYSREELLGQSCTILNCDRCRDLKPCNGPPVPAFPGWRRAPLPLRARPEKMVPPCPSSKMRPS